MVTVVEKSVCLNKDASKNILTSNFSVKENSGKNFFFSEKKVWHVNYLNTRLKPV